MLEREFSVFIKFGRTREKGTSHGDTVVVVNIQAASGSKSKFLVAVCALRKSDDRAVGGGGVGAGRAQHVPTKQQPPGQGHPCADPHSQVRGHHRCWRGQHDDDDDDAPGGHQQSAGAPRKKRRDHRCRRRGHHRGGGQGRPRLAAAHAARGTFLFIFCGLPLG